VLRYCRKSQRQQRTSGGPVPRSIRHLIAIAFAATAMSVAAVPVFAADAPVLTGTVVDANGQPFPVENGLLEMTAPDGGGIHAAQVSVGGDGSFGVEVMPWGTESNPAEATITITGVVADTTEDAAGCTNQFAPVAEATFSLALESGVEPDPVALVAEEQLIGTVCGAGGSSGPTLPPSEVDPVTPAPSEPPAVVEPVSPAPSHPLLVLEPVTPVDDSGVPTVLIGVIAAGVIALIGVGAWLGLRRSRA
jgi:hypothetical protein